MITRVVVFGMLTVSLVRSQSVPPSPENLTTLEIAALKTAAAWQVLSRDLDFRLARMLPCDTRTKTAIDEVARASQARLGALGEYYDALARDAKVRKESAIMLLASEEARLADVNASLAQAEESVSALAKPQLEALTESVKQRSSLDSAQAALTQNQASTRDGVASVKNVAARRAPLIAALKELVSAAEARDAALIETRTNFEAERARWNGYYAARLARSETECAIISPSAAPARAVPRSASPAPATGKAK